MLTKSCIAVGLLLILANRFANAQNKPKLCTESASMAFNATQLSGIWWEIARDPAISPMGCIKVNVSVDEPENVLKIATTYSVSSSYLWVNQTMYANISLANDDVASPNGYNFSYVNGIAGPDYAVYKLLDTDYNNYAFVCGYTNATNNATSFGILLMRDRNPNSTAIIDWENTASTQYADFTMGTMPLVTQTPLCYASDAMERFSLIATIIAALCAILNTFIFKLF